MVELQGSVLIWELRVLGWEVSYGAEFSPDAENGYTVIIQKARKFTATDEAYVKNSFKIGEPGKVVLTIDNTSSKKKKLLYRYSKITILQSGSTKTSLPILSRFSYLIEENVELRFGVHILLHLIAYTINMLLKKELALFLNIV